MFFGLQLHFAPYHNLLYYDVYMLINTLYIEVENPDSSTDSSTDIVLLLDIFYIGPGSCGLFNLEG